MILGTGIDLVEIERFVHWQNKPQKSLERIFSPAEIAYCLSNPLKSAERFALRFAAKEAFFKAFQPMASKKKPALLTICRNASVAPDCSGLPRLVVLWENISLNPNIDPHKLIIHLTASHSRLTTTAMVIIEIKE